MAKDVTELIKRAAEAASQVPEHLQEAAFNRAFEFLTGEVEGTGVSLQRSVGLGSIKTKRARRSHGTGESENRSAGKLNRTNHPEIQHGKSVLDNSLLLLRAAREDLEIDGLSASEIARVLSGKFRCSVTRQAVGNALNRAGRYVDRQDGGGSVTFRIMAPGEEYLDNRAHADDNATSASRVTDRKKKRKKSGRRKTRAKAQGSQSNGETVSVSNGRGSRRPGTGPTATMTSLFESGFFSEPRTIGDIVEKIQHDYGRKVKSSELSPSLLRWLRSGKVTRKQNADGQYAYQQK